MAVGDGGGGCSSSSGRQSSRSKSPGLPTAERRLSKELSDNVWDSTLQIAVQRSPENRLDVHFAFHNFAQCTPYYGGCYHGVLIFPDEYPYKPPVIQMRTASGRFEQNQSICTTLSAWHPEEWSPSCTAFILLQALLVYFQEDHEHGIGACKGVTDAQRKELAEASWSANAADPEFRRHFPELMKAWTARLPFSAQPGVAVRVVDLDLEAGGRPADAEPVAGEAQAKAAEECELCWICLLEAGTREPLISPCGCRGTTGGVHKMCLFDFVRHRAKLYQKDPLRCRVCRHDYIGLRVSHRLVAPPSTSNAQSICAFFMLYLTMSGFLMSIFLRFLIEDAPTRYSVIGVAAFLLMVSSWRIWWLMKSETTVATYAQQVVDVLEDPEAWAEAERAALAVAAEGAAAIAVAGAAALRGAGAGGGRSGSGKNAVIAAADARREVQVEDRLPGPLAAV